MNFSTLQKQIERHWPGQAQCRVDASTSTSEVTCTRTVLAEVCRRMVEEWHCSFAGLIVEEGASAWQLRYAFYGEGEGSWVHVLVSAPLAEKVFPSVVEWIHAADWHEREAEDMFGVRFEGHPHLGDFVLHDDVWQEGVEPMRHGFNAQTAMHNRRPNVDWRPRRIVQEPGAFIMPIGPKFSGITESVHFLLETVGEDVIRSSTRLFYKWRAVEKLAEGKTVEEGLLLAERFAATTAFAHGLAFCQGVESVCSVQVPPRARALRVFLAELERLRQHAGAIQEICESTALAVATSQAGLLEEELLRLSGELTGHRYLFGLLAPGGLLCDLPTDACRGTLERARDILKRLNELERRLSVSSSFLDRIEDVGVIPAANREGLQPGRPGRARLGTHPRSAPDAAVFGLRGVQFRCAERTRRRWLCAASGVVRGKPAIGPHHGADGDGADGRRGVSGGAIPFGCRARLGRGAARCNVPLGEVGRRRTDRALPDRDAVFHQLA